MNEASVKKLKTSKVARAEIGVWREQANDAFPERSRVIDALLICAVARANIILYGPPGTAKSLLARSFADAIQGSVFDVLMTRYTTPNELMGPVDVQALKNGSMRRVTKGYLPTAQVAFFDEGFKANSACLNALLSAVNEHIYHDDGQAKPIPLRVAVLASNEFPEDNDNLQAFDDRFPMRFNVEGLKDADSFSAMIRNELVAPTATIDVESIELLQRESKQVEVTPEAVAALRSIQRALLEKGIYASDRKMHISAKLLQAQAAIAGKKKVTTTGLGLLEDILWLRPDKRAEVKAIVADHVAEWLRDLRAAQDVVDEQEGAMKAAIKAKSDMQAMARAVAHCAQKLKDLDREVLKELEQDPDACDDVVDLRARLNSILKLGRKAMTAMI